MRAFFCLLCCLTAFSAATPAGAVETYKVGDAFEPFTTQDQHEKTYTFAPGVRLVLVSFTMSAGKEVNRFLEKQPAAFLDGHQSIFLSNIHGMPAIGRFFAMPKMKKYPHRILLADAEHFLDRYPREEEKITVLRLAPDARITAIEFVLPEKQLAGIFVAPGK